MSRREWLLLVALLAALFLDFWQDRQTEKALTAISQQLDANERARIDMLEARIIALEKTQARLRAEVEGGN